MVEVKIKFKDKNRSDLTLKTPENMEPWWMEGLIKIPVATNGKVAVYKTFSTDIIEEITEVVRHQNEEDLK